MTISFFSGLTIMDHICSLKMTTVRELKMIEIMEAITDKPNWENKVLTCSTPSPITQFSRS